MVKMSILEDKGTNVLEDIDFLLDLCQDLIKSFKIISPSEDIPIDRKQIAKLNSIAKRIHRKSNSHDLGID